MVFIGHSSRTNSAVSFARPSAFYGVRFPGLWEYFADVKFIEIPIPIVKAHPPGSVRLFRFEN